MVIVDLIGGLGNQMFQYAFMVAYNKKHLLNARLNKQTFNEYKTWPYQLDIFNINAKFASETGIQKFNNAPHVPPLHHFSISALRHPRIISENDNMKYNPLYLRQIGNINFRGYFQTEMYFAKYRDKICRDFTLRIPLNTENLKMRDKICACNSVSLHVRRGDYVKLQHVHGLCSLDYYTRAIDYVAERVDAPHFFLFSDDPKWVQENLNIKHPSTVVDINTASRGYFDMELMRNCKHNIIANSSFSWWGAWLNTNKNKIVIAPNQWFADNKPNDIVPEQWIKF